MPSDRTKLIIAFVFVGVTAVAALVVASIAVTKDFDPNVDSLNIGSDLKANEVTVNRRLNANDVEANKISSEKLYVGVANETILSVLNSGDILSNTLTSTSNITTKFLALQSESNKTMNLRSSAESNFDLFLPSTVGVEGQILERTESNGLDWKTLKKDNFTAVRPPTVKDDISLGYSTGSVWLIPKSRNTWTCTSNELENALWVDVSSTNPFDQLLNSDSNASFNSLELTDSLTLGKSSSGAGTILSTASTSSYEMIFPPIQGLDTSTLVNDGNGNLNWRLPILNNIAGNSDPSENNDSSQGYSIGSTWFNANTRNIFTCVSAVARVADWKQINNSVISDQNLSTFDVVEFAQIISPEITVVGQGSFRTKIESAAAENYSLKLPEKAPVESQYLETIGLDGQMVWRSLLKNNFDSGFNPTELNDSSQGYSIGSIWINQLLNRFFICLDASVENAVWSGGVDRVFGTADEIISSGGHVPVISLSPLILNDLKSWTKIAPLNQGKDSQILVFNGNRLEWKDAGFSAESRDVFVDISGSDQDGVGSNLSPFRTVGKALSFTKENLNPSTFDPVSININSGLYEIENPLISEKGINFLGKSRGTIFVAKNTDVPIITSTNNDLNVENIVFKGTLQGFCISLNAEFFGNINNCTFDSFTIAIQCIGDGRIDTNLIVQQNVFSNNILALSLNGVKCTLANTQILGLITQDPSVSYSGITVSGNNTALYCTSTIFGNLGTACNVFSTGIAFLIGANFTNNLIGVKNQGAGNSTIQGCVFNYMQTGQIAIVSQGPGTNTDVSSSTILGTNYEGEITGVGMTNYLSARLRVSGCTIRKCKLGVECGFSSDASDTDTTVNTTTFEECVVSISQKGTTTLKCNDVSLDDSETLAFDDPTNVKLIFTSTAKANSFLCIGPIAKVPFSVIELAVSTKQEDCPEIQFSPTLLSKNAETLMFEQDAENIDVAIACQTKSGNATLAAVTDDLNMVSELRLYSTSGELNRGWDIRKTAGNANLQFVFNNTIVGQVNQDTTQLELNAVQDIIEIPSSSLRFKSDTTLNRLSTKILSTNGTLQIQSQESDRVLITDEDSIIKSSPISSGDLLKISGLSENVQTQLDNCVLKTGSTMSGNLRLPNGTESNLSLNIQGSGMFSPQANKLSFVTNNAARLSINSVGELSFLDYSKGILHSSLDGVISSRLISNEDILDGSIKNTQLSEASSSNISNNLVQRDETGSFAVTSIQLSRSPVLNLDAVNKGYVDSVAGNGFRVLTPVLVVAITNTVLSGLQTIDGVDLFENDRVMIENQTNEIENGPWTVQKQAWLRPFDFEIGSTTGPAYVLISSGDSKEGSSYFCTTPDSVVGTDKITFTLFSLPQTTTATNIGNGNGVFKESVGNNLSFKTLTADPNTMIIAPTNNSNELKFQVKSSSENTANSIAIRDVNGDFEARTITANVTGRASLNLSNTGGTLTGNLKVPLGTETVPSLSFGTNSTGVSAINEAVNLITNGKNNLSIFETNIQSNILKKTGVLHTDSSGVFSTSLLKAEDIDPSTRISAVNIEKINIADKVGNIATTASSEKGLNTIISRDETGSFSANTITAENFVGNVEGSSSENVAKNGDIMTGPLKLPTGNAAVPSLQIGTTNTGLYSRSGSLEFSTSGNSRFAISESGALSIKNLLNGVLHVTEGLVTSSKVTGIDIAENASILNSQLNQLTEKNKVANSATSANSLDLPNTIVQRDAQGAFFANVVKASVFEGSLSGTASGNLPLTGGDLSGNLLLPALSLGDSSVGLASSTENDLKIITGATTRVNISKTGIIKVPEFKDGVLHSSAVGEISSRSLINSDISSDAKITDNKLSTIETANKVSNSATTANSTNIGNHIVLRDGAGNFHANNISANIFTGNVDGKSNLNILKTGDTMTGKLILPEGSASNPSLQIGANVTGLASVAGNIELCTNRISRVKIGTSGEFTVSSLNQGVVKSSQNGTFGSSLITATDISPNAEISNNQLENTPTVANVNNTIVLRDENGDFGVNTINVSKSIVVGKNDYNNYTLPSARGNDGQVLKTNQNGAAYWADEEFTTSAAFQPFSTSQITTSSKVKTETRVFKLFNPIKTRISLANIFINKDDEKKSPNKKSSFIRFAIYDGHGCTARRMTQTARNFLVTPETGLVEKRFDDSIELQSGQAFSIAISFQITDDNKRDDFEVFSRDDGVESTEFAYEAYISYSTSLSFPFLLNNISFLKQTTKDRLWFLLK